VMSRVSIKTFNLLCTKIGLYHIRSDPFRKGDKGQSVGKGQRRKQKREDGYSRARVIIAKAEELYGAWNHLKL
jgi:hypothetical protein